MKLMKGINFILLFLCIVFISCNRVKKEEYISWLKNEENGFLKKRSINTTTVEVQYTDSIYQVLNNKSKEPISHLFYIHIYDNEKRENIAVITANNYSYFSFSMEKDIYIKVKDETFPCRLFHYEQSHGKLGELHFIAGFELADIEKESIQLIINSQPFQIGAVKFNFDLDKLPVIY